MKEQILEILNETADNLSYEDVHGEFSPFVIKKEDFEELANRLEAIVRQGVSQPCAFADIDREKIYRTALQIWGAELQMNMLIEECAELIQSINKYRRKGSENILEEIADVEIMLEQARMILGDENSKIIDIHKKDKLNRLADKLLLKANASA